MDTKIKKFVDNFYPDPEKTKDIIKNILKDKKYSVKYSSSMKSVIILLKDSVYKLMKPVSIYKNLDYNSKTKELIEYNKEAIPLLFNCSEIFVICIKSIVITPNINIIEYEKLHDIKPKYKLRKLLLMLYQISYTLRNIHKKGYYHKDVYLSNIGCRIKRGEYDFILYDFELADTFTLGEKPSEMYTDIKIFLDDLIKAYKDDILYKVFIENILDILNKNSMIETGDTITIIKTTHKIYKNIYEYRDFNKLILKLIKYFTNTSRDIKDMIEYMHTL